MGMKNSFPGRRNCTIKCKRQKERLVHVMKYRPSRELEYNRLVGGGGRQWKVLTPGK